MAGAGIVVAALLRKLGLFSRSAFLEATLMVSDCTLEFIRTGGPCRRPIDLRPHQLLRPQIKE